MRIIRNGNTKIVNRKKYLKFKCDICGCELEADNTEYKSRTVEYGTTDYFIDCPDCENEIRYKENV